MTLTLTFSHIPHQTRENMAPVKSQRKRRTQQLPLIQHHPTHHRVHAAAPTKPNIRCKHYPAPIHRSTLLIPKHTHQKLPKSHLQQDHTHQPPPSPRFRGPIIHQDDLINDPKAVLKSAPRLPSTIAVEVIGKQGMGRRSAVVTGVMSVEAGERSWDSICRGDGGKGDKAWWCRYVY